MEGRPRRQPDRPPDLAERKAIERLLAGLPEAGAVPRKEGELSFEAPWEIRALGMAVAAHEEGHFPWPEFQHQLVTAIKEWEAAPADERGEWTYYRYFVRALERLAEERGLADTTEIDRRTEEILATQKQRKH
jgi:nitrile hydratase accessory protein